MSDLLEPQLYEKFTRREIHDWFVENGKFTPNAGTWGLHGVVKIPNDAEDYVFFVTYGQEQSGFIFREGVSTHGVITWQSQPRQHLQEKRVLSWIGQKKSGNKIFLFARGNKKTPYTYLGQLSYVSHDIFRSYPVWFQFQIKNWNPPEHVKTEFVREVTSIGSKLKLETNNPISSKVPVPTPYIQNEYDKHVLNLLLENPMLIDAGDGFRYEKNVSFDSGEIADLVFYGPGREIKIVCICTQETDVTYIRAVKAKLWSVEMCFEKEEQIDSEFIQVYLIAKNINDITNRFCEKYGVLTLEV
tara:strand:- start:738 stop:1640 length:903 start_codon:yes stop_codon:yes gene_type:complete